MVTIKCEFDNIKSGKKITLKEYPDLGCFIGTRLSDLPDKIIIPISELTPEKVSINPIKVIIDTYSSVLVNHIISVSKDNLDKARWLAENLEILVEIPEYKSEKIQYMKMTIADYLERMAEDLGKKVSSRILKSIEIKKIEE